MTDSKRSPYVDISSSNLLCMSSFPLVFFNLNFPYIPSSYPELSSIHCLILFNIHFSLTPETSSMAGTCLSWLFSCSHCPICTDSALIYAPKDDSQRTASPGLSADRVYIFLCQQKARKGDGRL